MVDTPYACLAVKKQSKEVSSEGFSWNHYKHLPHQAPASTPS